MAGHSKAKCYLSYKILPNRIYLDAEKKSAISRGEGKFESNFFDKYIFLVNLYFNFRESHQLECCRSIKLDNEFFKIKCSKFSTKADFPCCQYYAECTKVVKESFVLTKGVILGAFCFIVILCFVYVYCKFLFKWNEGREEET